MPNKIEHVFIKDRDGALWAGSFWTFVPMFAKLYTIGEAADIIQRRFARYPVRPKVIPYGEVLKKSRRKITIKSAERYCARYDDALIIEGNEYADAI